MAILVTGGAGYIGSVTVEVLRARGRDVVVLDDLSTGHRAAVPPDVTLVRASAGDAAAVERLCSEREVSAALHFAALSSVAESVEHPARYHQANVADGLALLGALERAGVRRFIFSSSASVYGGASGPLAENAPLAPGNPYGFTKVILERALADFAAAYGWRSISLRYFNAAGASAAHGEDHRPETHLIPLAIRAARGEGEAALEIYGTDYATPDGTCVRDYIHVADLAEAHVLALEALDAGHGGGTYNLGNGRGFTVREVLQAVEAATGCPVPVKAGVRRPGDPPMLVASAQRARVDLGWRPHRGEIEDIIASAAAWMEKHPEGYGAGEGGEP